MAGTDSTTRSGHGAMLLWDGQVLLVGGVWDLQNRHERAPAPLYTEVFDPQTGRVASGGPIRFSQSFFSFSELSSRQVLVAGGLGQDGAVARAASSTWRPRA